MCTQVPQKRDMRDAKKRRVGVFRLRLIACTNFSSCPNLCEIWLGRRAGHRDLGQAVGGWASCKVTLLFPLSRADRSQHVGNRNAANRRDTKAEATVMASQRGGLPRQATAILISIRTGSANGPRFGYQLANEARCTETGLRIRRYRN